MEADLSRVPLLALTADRPPELRGIGANQTVDQVGMYGSAVRWARDVAVPEARPDSVATWRALAAAAVGHCLGDTGAPVGPVHLNLPLREPLTPTDDGIGFPYDLGAGAGPAPQPARHDTAPPSLPPLLAGRLAAARTGVVVAGGSGAMSRAGSSVGAGRFARRAGWPLIAEPHSGARHGAMALRSTDGLLRDPAFTTEHRPDLVVVVGRVGLSRALLDWLATVPHVVVSPDGGNWDVTGTAEAVIHCPLDALADVEAPPAPAEWAQAWLDASARVSGRIDAILDSSPTVTEPRTARDVAALLPDDSALVVGSSMPIRDLDLTMHPRERLAVFANRGVSGIDGFVSTAQGIATAYDRGPTVALCGDLSLLHDINGLLPGPDARPDITYVVINNDGGGIFSLLPQASSVAPEAFERVFGTPHGMSLERLAAAYDVTYTSVTDPAELATALSSFNGVRLIEIPSDRADNARLHARLREVTSRTA